MKLFTINGVYIKAFSKLHGLEHGFVRHWLNLSMFKLLAQKVYIFVSKAQSNQRILSAIGLVLLRGYISKAHILFYHRGK